MLRSARKVCAITTRYAATMYHGKGVPVTMRRQPNATPRATPSATAKRNPHAPTAPPETCCAFNATAMSEGSATVVAKPMAAPKA